jgi:orotate phosphoribosyltransferase
MLIGDKIRSLRKNKNITQTQLAEVLSVSAQSVSKWENHLSVPDISVLPVIARYFGITMDDLFSYRLDALTYKERFIRFMVDNGMLRFEDRPLSNGRVSPYYIHSGYHRMGSQISRLGEFYAECIREHGIESNCLVGVNEREIPLLIATGMTLFAKYGVDSHYCMNYIAEKDALLSRDITLITDTLSSGATMRRVLDRMKAEIGRYPSHIVIYVDRMEKTDHSSLSAKHEIEKDYGVRIHNIITLEDIIHAVSHGVIHAGENYDKLLHYAERYRGE